ncbi:MAG: AAA family ATPase, partial [Planktothrix sp.]
MKAPIADQVWVQQKVASFCHDTSSIPGKKDTAIQESLVRACLGLAQGEIELILQQSLAFTNSFEDIPDWVLNYKVNKLRGRGLELISEPDVAQTG